MHVWSVGKHYLKTITKSSYPKIMNTNFTLIDKYFKNELTASDQVEFNQQLDSDPVFAEEFAFQRSMHIYSEGIQHKAQLTQKLNNLGQEFFTKEAKPKSAKIIKNKFFRVLVSAAAIGLLLIMFNPFSSQDLYQNFAQHRNLALIVKSDNSDWAKKAEHDFNTQNYNQAIVDLNAYLKENPNHQRALLALGISHLETNQTEEAIQIFSKIKAGNSTLNNYGTWYLALTYVKNKDFEKANQLLKEIPSSDKGLYAQAQKLMKEL